MSTIPPPGRERDLLLYNTLFPNGEQGRGYPHYSTDDAAALEVLEAMQKRWYGEAGGDADLYWQLRDCYPHGWRADIIWAHHDGDIPVNSESGATLADAITAAAIRTIEAEETTERGEK